MDEPKQPAYEKKDAPVAEASKPQQSEEQKLPQQTCSVCGKTGVPMVKNIFGTTICRPCAVAKGKVML